MENVFGQGKELPTKLAHIKNTMYLTNSFDPITQQYVKKVWAYKLTKLGKEKRDLIWEYFRHRGKLAVTEALRNSFYLGVPKIKIVFFGVSAMHDLEMTADIAKTYKRVRKIRINKNSIDPFNNNKVKTIYWKKELKNKRIWDVRAYDGVMKAEEISVANVLKKLWKDNRKNVIIKYVDGSVQERILDLEWMEILEARMEVQ